MGNISSLPISSGEQPDTDSHGNQVKLNYLINYKDPGGRNQKQQMQQERRSGAEGRPGLARAQGVMGNGLNSDAPVPPQLVIQTFSPVVVTTSGFVIYPITG